MRDALELGTPWRRGDSRLLLERVTAPLITRSRGHRARLTPRTLCASLAGLLLLAAVPLFGQRANLRVTVFDEKTGQPVKDLNASNFSVLDDKTQLRVERAEYKENLLDVMLLVDTSQVGEMVRGLAEAFIDGLGDNEPMAIVAYHDAADLIQDFTSTKKSLHRALAQVKYGNNPRVLDALYAAMDEGFQHTAGRRVVVLLSAGVEGFSEVPEPEVLQVARRRGVSIYPVFVVGAERGMFRRLAQRSGGAYFGARKLKLDPRPLSELVYSVVRGQYELEVSGVHTLGDRTKVTIQGLPKSKKKVWASALPME